ncbi:MAG: type II toxin-antitoxin system VapC family toxin [Firmicutes bacterium]|jgi:predicted nucleic acid-binding protein|nr:type II toxin-antitoxin system VapC family toxin [Bacillota bacterium]NBI63463.1 PIN domain protein [Clostridiales bacterium]
MNLYLDNCCYNRPFDDQTQLKIHLETQAKLHIQSQIKNDFYELTWSYVLDYENGRNPFPEKRKAIQPWKEIASVCVSEANPKLLAYADHLKRKGIKTFDALHIACAVEAKCDYYLTTDKKLLNANLSEIKILSPIAFIEEEEKWK